ncbi:MAG: chromosomal replication initiator protein DnaA [Thermaerobacter sp.]|nr:chromosomal replication initiator protein DnaA [Thermaerobacter sp.]
MESIWSKACVLLQRELPRPSYEIWVHPAEPVALSDGCVTLGVPSESARATLDEHYRGQILRALHSAAGAQLDVRFTVIERKAPEAPTPPARSGGDGTETVVRATLQSRYTFDGYVVGNSNRLAHAAALAVAEMPGRAYNPLFIYGGVGLGKTHLMQAIGNQALLRRPNLKILYVPAETFTNEMVNSVRDNKGPEFRNRYRTIDLLLIDDIQFIAGKVGTQEEFFHTFEALYGAQKQIVLSSDRPPKEITTLENRLRSRFEWGLITDIQQPDFEMRLAILRKKSLADNLDVEDAALEFIATHIETNIRELEGAFIRFIAYCSVHHFPFTYDHAADALRDLLPVQRERKVTILAIQQKVADYYSLDLADLTAKKRTRAVSYPRQIAMYLAREMTDSSLPKIGAEFGGRDHTTVLHACDKISGDLRNDPEFRKVLSGLKEKIRS